MSPLDQAVEAYVPASLRQQLIDLEQDPAHAGHSSDAKMCTSTRRANYEEAMITNLHAFVAGRVTCANSKDQVRRCTAPSICSPRGSHFRMSGSTSAAPFLCRSGEMLYRRNCLPVYKIGECYPNPRGRCREGPGGVL